MGNSCCSNSSNQTVDMPKQGKGKSKKERKNKLNEMEIGTIDEQDLLKPAPRQRPIESPRGLNDKHYVSSNTNFLLKGEDPNLSAKNAAEIYCQDNPDYMYTGKWKNVQQIEGNEEVSWFQVCTKEEKQIKFKDHSR